MPLLIRCPQCKKALKVRDELAGKKVKCPSCATPVPVPAVEPKPELEVVEAVEEEPPSKSVKAGGPAKTKPKAPPPVEEEEEELEEEVVKDKAKKKSSKSSGQWVPCPKCDAEGARRVKYTVWGSFYGPRIFNHVRCQECGATYNGKTGGSNIIPAIGCITIPLVGIALILGLLGGYIYYLRVYQPAQAEQQEMERLKQPVRPNPKIK